MLQTNGGFVYVGLNGDCLPNVSEQQLRNNIWCHLRILLHQSRQTITTNSMELYKQSSPFQMNHLHGRHVF